MNKNFYDMTNVTGKSISDAKRIQAQTADFLKKYDQNLQESLQAEEDKKMSAAMSGARFGYAANVARSNARINKLNEEIRYTNESSVIGMTEMVAAVVEKALLLDEGELVKIYPEYKDDIRSIVKDFLKEGEINSTITNPETLALMEYVSKKLPGVREGMTLTEDELGNYIAMNKPLDIERSLKNLSGSVSSRVATLMEKEQKKAEQIEKDVKRAKAKEEKAAATDEASIEDIMAALESGEMTEKDLDNMLKNGEISQNTYDAVINAYEEAVSGQGAEDPAAMEDPNAMAGGAPVTTSDEAMEDPNAMAGGEMDPSMVGAEDPAMDPAAMEDPNAMAGGEMDPSMQNADPAAMGGVAPGTPKKQVQMLPDGTMTINIFENDFAFVRETPRCGLIESLAVNEATNMLNEGKSYDGDLCLAKALMYVTITEAMDELGLMDVDAKKYSKIISEAGGKAEAMVGNEPKGENKKSGEMFQTSDRFFDSGEPRLKKQAATRKFLEPTDKYGRTSTFHPLSGEHIPDVKKFRSKVASGKTTPDSKPLSSTASSKKEASTQKPLPEDSFKETIPPTPSGGHQTRHNLSESVLVNQYTPVRNDMTNPDSIAERIRQKRLNEQTSEEKRQCKLERLEGKRSKIDTKIKALTDKPQTKGDITNLMYNRDTIYRPFIRDLDRKVSTEGKSSEAEE